MTLVDAIVMIGVFICGIIALIAGSRKMGDDKIASGVFYLWLGFACLLVLVLYALSASEGLQKRCESAKGTLVKGTCYDLRHAPKIELK